MVGGPPGGVLLRPAISSVKRSVGELPAAYDSGPTSFGCPVGGGRWIRLMTIGPEMPLAGQLEAIASLHAPKASACTPRSVVTLLPPLPVVATMLNRSAPGVAAGSRVQGNCLLAGLAGVVHTFPLPWTSGTAVLVAESVTVTVWFVVPVGKRTFATIPSVHTPFVKYRFERLSFGHEPAVRKTPGLVITGAAGVV